MNKIKGLVILLLTVINNSLFAQSSPVPNDLMHSNGKIYVVVLVLLVILSGLFIYLINLDRKITNLEKE